MGNQSSSLHNAAAHNDLGKVEALITYQHANVNDRDKDGWTPLHFAAYGGALEVTQSLLLRGADAEPKDKADRTPLHLAALRSHTQLASLLLGRGAHVDAKDENAMTPLHKAAINGNVEVGTLLIRLGADAEAAVKDGTKCIHLASWKGHPEFVKLLLAQGVDVRATTHNGRTALHEAAESGHSDIVKLLLSAGANPHAQDKEGQIPASLASHAGHKDIAELFARGGAGGPIHRAGDSPSAPPLPGHSSGAVQYPQIYQGGGAPGGEKAKESQRNKDFWAENLGEKGSEQGRNQGFWGAALGGGDSSAPQKPARRNEAAEEVARRGPGASPGNKAFWDEKMSGGVPSMQRLAAEWDKRMGRAANAWDAQLRQEEQATGPARPQEVHQEEQHPRKQFEQNILRGAQGLWNTLQGKGPDDADAQKQREAERKRREAEDIDAEWGGKPRGAAAAKGGQPDVPSQQLYDLKPYEDDDDYEETAPSSRQGGKDTKDSALARRKLAQLELNLDREQGWVRGGSKEEGDAVRARQQRIRDQELEIAHLRNQLAMGRH